LRPTAGRGEAFLQVGSLGERANLLRVDGAHPFAAMIQRLYDIRTTSGSGVPDDRDIGIYGQDFLDLAGQVMRMRYAAIDDPRAVLTRRSVVCAPETPRMELQDVRNTMDASNVLFGANRNRWTDVKLAESFSRIMTGRRISARLVHRYLDTLTGETVDLENGALAETGLLDLPNPEAVAVMKQVLARVPLRAGGGYPEGTADFLHDTAKTMEREVPGFRFYGKTGPIDDGCLGDPDSRLFLCTFGLEENGELTRESFTLVVYLKTALDEDAPLKIVRDYLQRWYPLLAATAQPPKPADGSKGAP